MYFNKFFLCSILLTISYTSSAELPQNSRRAGGIAVIPLSADTTQVFYKRNPVLITQQNEQLYAVLGIPLSTPIGKLTLTTNTKPIEIEIISYPYAEQRLTVVNQDYVNPNQDQLDRYAREAKEQNDVYSSFSNNNWTHFPNFIRPTAGKFSNSFG